MLSCIHQREDTRIVIILRGLRKIQLSKLANLSVKEMGLVPCPSSLRFTTQCMLRASYCKYLQLSTWGCSSACLVKDGQVEGNASRESSSANCGIYPISSLLFQGWDSFVPCSMMSPKVPRLIDPQLPTVASRINYISFIGCLPFPVLHLHFSSGVPWDHLPNKLFALKFSFQGPKSHACPSPPP